MITFGSVCSGIEAASSAWHPLGWRAEWFAEIEKFPAAVLAYHYPQVPNLGDMTKIANRIRNGEIEAPDALVGGTPCQAFSLAGLRNSMADARGQLTLSYVDLANAIDSARHLRGKPACIIVWENVPGVLSTSDNAFGCFLAALAGEDRELLPPRDDRGRPLSWPNAGCVFGPQRTIAWRVLDAQYFGVAQRRRRVFVVASARKGFDPTTVLFEFDGLRRDTAPSREQGQEAAAGTLRSTDGGCDVDHACAGHIQPAGWPAEVTSTLNASFGSKLGLENQHIAGGQLYSSQLARCLTTKTRIDAETETLIPTIGGVFVDAAIAFDCRQDPVSSTEVFGALGSSSPQSQAVSYAIQAGALRTNPNSGPDGVGVQESIAYTLEARAEVQAVAVLPFDTTQITSATNRSQPDYGDPSHPLAAGAHAPAICVTGDVTHTLKAEGFAASEDGTGRGQPIVAAFQSSQSGVRLSDTHATLDANNGPRRHNGALVDMAVRRLTPRECERLQSFPDDYTLIPYGRPVRMEKLEQDWIKYLLRGGVMTLEQVCQAAADGPRYKALGNSMCVYNMRWIGARIDAQLRALEAA